MQFTQEQINTVVNAIKDSKKLEELKGNLVIRRDCVNSIKFFSKTYLNNESTKESTDEFFSAFKILVEAIINNPDKLIDLVSKDYVKSVAIRVIKEEKRRMEYEKETIAILKQYESIGE